MKKLSNLWARLVMLVLVMSVIVAVYASPALADGAGLATRWGKCVYWYGGWAWWYWYYGYC